jgi:hypothetical protein
VAVQLAGERLRQVASLLGLELAEAPLVRLERRVRRARRLVEHRLGGARQRVRGEQVERVLPVAAIPYEPALAKPCQVRGHARLRDARHADEVRDAEFAVAQQRAEPDATLVAQEIQRADVLGEAHVSAYDDARM